MKRYVRLLGYIVRFIYHSKLRPSERASVIVYEAVSDLGGLFVKLMQFIALRTEIFPDTDKARLLSFYDRVAVDKLDVLAVVTQQLGRANLAKFRTIENEPFAAGSFAQIYKAVLTNGQEVVIKVQRANLRVYLWFDFLAIKILSLIVDFLYDLKQMNLPQMIADFRQVTFSELDYLLEVKQASRFAQMYQNHPHLVIPKVYPELSTAKIIVEDYINGVPLTEVIRRRFTGEDCRAWARRELATDLHQVLFSICYEIGISLFKHDIFYADPHPGNIFLLGNNRYALVDFGIVGHAPKDKLTYYKIVKEITKSVDQLDTESMSDVILKFSAGKLMKSLSVFYPDSKEVGKSAAEFVRSNFAQLIEENKELLKTTEFVGEEKDFTNFLVLLMTSLGQKYQLQLPEGMFVIGRTSQLYKSYTLLLDPGVKFMGQLFRKWIEVIDPTTLVRKDVNTSNVGVFSYDEAVENVADWLSCLASQDVALYRQVYHYVRHN